MPYSVDLKALYILRQNVRDLLLARKESEAWLAQCLGFKHRSSLNKFLNSERAGFQMSRLDKMARVLRTAGLPVVSAGDQRGHGTSYRSQSTLWQRPPRRARPPTSGRVTRRDRTTQPPQREGSSCRVVVAARGHPAHHGRRRTESLCSYFTRRVWGTSSSGSPATPHTT